MQETKSKIAILVPRKINFRKTVIRKLVTLLRDELDFSVTNLNISFVSKEDILKINSQYLQHHFTTDIITFNYNGSNSVLDGELLISYEDAITNAIRFKTEPETEYLRLIIHGVLHLVGYDDQSKNDKILMKRIENKLVNKFSYLLQGIAA